MPHRYALEDHIKSLPQCKYWYRLSLKQAIHHCAISALAKVQLPSQGVTEINAYVYDIPSQPIKKGSSEETWFYFSVIISLTFWKLYIKNK